MAKPLGRTMGVRALGLALLGVMVSVSAAGAETEVFVKKGEPVNVGGSGTERMQRRGDALFVPAAQRWGNAVEAGLQIKKGEFRIRARLTLEELGEEGVSFIMGGGYHSQFAPPEGRRSMRIWLDGADGKIYLVDNASRTAGGWALINVQDEAKRRRLRRGGRRAVGDVNDYITAGEPFTFELQREGDVWRLRIDGERVFAEKLKLARWPVSFGFLAERAPLRIHAFEAEGAFARPRLEHTTLWVTGHGGYNSYRAPSLCTTPDGVVLAFAHGHRPGPRKKAELDAFYKRSTDGGRTWSESRELWDPGEPWYEARSPVPVVDRERGVVFVVMRSNVKPGSDEPGPFRLYVMRSEDNGKTWTDPRPMGVLGPQMESVTISPCHGIQLERGPHRGRLIVPCYADVDGKRQSRVAYSDDHGETWRLGEPVPYAKTSECTVVELAGGKLLISCRGGKEAGEYISEDGGETWREADRRIPRERHVDATLLRYDWPEKASDEKGRILLSQPVTRSRRRMTVKMSRDGTHTWPAERLVYPGGAAYSGMAVLPNGDVGLIYEKDDYRTIDFVRFRPEWVTGK